MLQLDLFKTGPAHGPHLPHLPDRAQLLHSLQSERFDLLIVDWHLPDTTGQVVRWGAPTCGGWKCPFCS